MIAPVLRLTAFAFVLAVTPASAVEAPVSQVNTLAGDRIAIEGYDPVAYFVDGEPRRGRADLAVEHRGAVWRFASEANRRRFAANPERFTPAYGGYCAYGVSRGYLVTVDPAAWTIVEDRLYLNYDPSIRDAWLKDPRAFIAKADRTWPKLAGGGVPAAP